MIICLYHGSTFKNINKDQTNPVTHQIKNTFNKDVYEAYYSNHVCNTLKRREGIDKSLKTLLKKTYDKYDFIYILTTHMIAGEEYNSFKELIKKIDINNKIKISKPLLHKNNIECLAKAITDKDNLTINIGHGSENLVKEYIRLNEILNENNNYVITLKDDFPQFLLNNVKQKNIILKPLMFTSGYHVKIDIEQKLYQEAKNLGYVVQIQPEGLCQNKQIVNVLISNLKSILKSSCVSYLN